MESDQRQFGVSVRIATSFLLMMMFMTLMLLDLDTQDGKKTYWMLMEMKRKMFKHSDGI